MDTARLAKILKALSHQKRLELYLQIAQKCEDDFETQCDCFICDIIDSLKLGAPTVSHHLKELVNADLITTERQGKFLVARANKELLEEVRQMLKL